MALPNNWTACTACGKKKTRTRRISRRGLCEECAIERIREANTSIQTKTGPKYEAWRAGMKAAAEGR